MLKYYDIDYILSMFQSAMMVAAVTFLSLLSNKLIRVWNEGNKIKKAQFTQNAIDKKHDDIINKLSEIAGINIDVMNFYNMDSYIETFFKEENLLDNPIKVEDAISVVSYFNILLSGISTNLYDEDIIKINYKKEIYFIGKYMREVNLYGFEDNLLHLEQIIRKWKDIDFNKKRGVRID